MTLPVVDGEDRRTRGVEGPAYKVGPRCSNPNCDRLSDHAHHLVRRSQLQKQPMDWVAIDGITTANKTGLCWRCHDDVDGKEGGHKAAIRWIDEQFWWCLVTSLITAPVPIQYHPVAPIEPQPPTPDSLTPLGEAPAPESCPFCGQERRRRPTPTRVGRRHRKSWTVLVPADEQENGADVLDSLVDNLAPQIPNADASATGRYYVVVAALAHALMDTKALMASLAGKDAA